MFTRVVFALAGIIGLGSLVPLYQQPGSPAYYALVGTVAAWQVLFLMIAWRPAELRLAMIPAVLEKLFWVVTIIAIYMRGGPAVINHVRGNWWRGILGGGGSILSYGLALWAMTKAPVAIVAALRETSILFAIVISVFILKERASIWRYIAGGIIAAGVLVMRLG